MKKVALALNQENELDHFGHCDHFDIFDITDDSIVTNESMVKNPEHQPGFLPKFLYDLGVQVVVAENLGARALQILEALKMEAIFGVQGKKEEVVSKLLSNELQSSDKCCEKHHDHNHEHHHEGHDHDSKDHHHHHHHHK